MASLSLPRVLQLKKNSLEAEREQFEKFQTLAVQKAINANETPVKEKHVRSTIIGTFQDQSAATYWMVAVRQPLQDNRIVAWKFCHVTHKLLREGHPACLDDSQRHITMIDNLGKLWVHLREGYGKLVYLYCKLLVCKIQFHARNPRFPGNMQLTSEELDAIAENDVNNYFQLCVELFDYLDDILTLQAAVFDSLGNARANSMTASGQCRLAALIPCAQDSSQIYDCNVRLLFQLHAALPADTLCGHRDRFRHQFKKLSSFYKHASSLQYYRNLLTLPMLPSNPPNFLLQSDFGTYVTPVVSIPEQTQDEPDAVGSLIDTSDILSQSSTPDQSEVMSESRASSSPQPDPLLERDRLIDHLQSELKRMRSEVSQLVQERNTMVASMREHCTRIETQLEAAKCERDEEKVKSESLSAQTPEITRKLTVVEEKAKVQDEKFQKLKGAYTQLREEHITLIRQKAEVDKMAANFRVATAEHECAKMSLQQQLNDRIKDVELLQQSASSSEEIEAYKTEIVNLRSDLDCSRQKEIQLETLQASMDALKIEHNAACAELQEQLSMMTSENKDLSETVQKVSQEKEVSDIELNNIKAELDSLKKRSEEECIKVTEEKNAALQQISVLTEQHNQEKQELDITINDLKIEYKSKQQEFSDKLELYSKEILACNQEKKEVTESFEQQINNIISQKESELNLLNSKLQIVSDTKEEILSNLKNIMTNQDDKVILLNVENQNLKVNNKCLQDDLNENKASLEVCNNKLESMKEEYGKNIENYEHNLSLKSNELKELNQKFLELSNEHNNVIADKEFLTNNLVLQEKEFNIKCEELTSSVQNLRNKYEEYKNEKEEATTQMKGEIANLTESLNQFETDKKEQQKRNAMNIEEMEVNFKTKIAEKVFMLSQAEKDWNDYKIEFEAKEMDYKNQIRSHLKNHALLENNVKMLEDRLDRSERDRLTAECGLQDLLQHNTDLEENVAALTAQLQEAQAQLEKQRTMTVSSASATGIEITDAALAALDRVSTYENRRDAAERAAATLASLETINHVQGNEETLAKSALLVAHNTSQLSSYITEVSNTCTDVQLCDKLTSECRTMLNTTKQCLESLNAGSLDMKISGEVQKHVANLVRATAAADTAQTTGRTVDDELADMDKAIEEAAGRIEEMLVASRAADSGVKLEVNSKILDACTTLMAAVKILVQDARRLQNELGDPKTRQKMYRKNPQWSEGLISAAKAVVFAAKLLVSSADEAVCGESGARAEGVSAAAHEVAGSTAQLVAASRARAPPASPALAALTGASRAVAAATGAVVAAVRASAALHNDQEALDTSALTLTATRRLEMESKVRSLELECALEAERVRLAALRKRHYQLAQREENGNMTNGKQD